MESATSTWHRVAAKPPRDTVSTRRVTGSGLTASTASCSTWSGTPAPSSAPSSMSPLAPDDASTHTTLRRSSGRGRRLPRDPGREDAGAVAVVDVDHGHAGSAGVQHREQRRDPAERGAVADAGRAPPRAVRRPGRRPRTAARPPCRRRPPGSRPAPAGRGPPAAGAPRRRRRPRSRRPRRRGPAPSARPRRRPGRRRSPPTRRPPSRARSAAARGSRRGRPGAARPRAGTSPPGRAPRRRAGWRAPPGRGAWRAACAGSPRPAPGVLPSP